MEINPLDRLLRITRDDNLLTNQQTAQTLIRGLAHEIKNPLGGIRGAAQLLYRELPDAELSARRKAWTPPPYKATRGTLYKYIKNVKSASEGCVTDE